MKNPFSSSQVYCDSSINHLPLLPSSPDGIGRQSIAQNPTFNTKGEIRRRGDSNPRNPVRVHTLSKRTPSASRTPLQLIYNILKSGNYPRCLNSSPGERGIRTLGADKQLNGFRGRPIQPLSHLSKAVSPFLYPRGFEPPTFRSAT